MNTFILYDSTFGRTGQLALIIAGRLGDYGTVKLFRIHEAGLPHLQNVDVLIIGCPTFQAGLSEGMHAFLERFPSGAFQNLAVATFDTCHHAAVQPPDSASHYLARRLQQEGATLLIPPCSFFVGQKEHQLNEQDIRGATHWAESIHEAFEAQRAVKNTVRETLHGR